METGELLEEESFDYQGSIALFDGGAGAGGIGAGKAGSPVGAEGGLGEGSPADYVGALGGISTGADAIHGFAGIETSLGKYR